MDKAVSVKSFLFNYLLAMFLCCMLLFVLSFILHIALPGATVSLINSIDLRLLFLYVLVGFIAQLIDGSLGMGYGVSSTSFLMSAGISPVLASASVHIAQIFTTATSGVFHWRLGNIDKNLFKKLIIPGAIGAFVGALLLTHIDSKLIKPYIGIYLALMGIIIVFKAFKKMALKEPKRVEPLALAGGFADSIGGGGWGPVVTTTLISKGCCPRKTIGTVCAAEFVVVVVASGVFIFFVGAQSLEIVTGLVLGGLAASPLGALLVSRINKKVCMILVGLLILFLSLRTILISIF